MKELAKEKKKELQEFFSNYGKVILSALLVLILVWVLADFVKTSSERVMHISFLDVGQGDSILIQTPSGHDMLIDGGPSDRVLEKLSKELGYFDRHIDVMLETHPDADHITGLIPILKNYTVDHLITSPLAGHTGVFGELEKSENEEHAEIHVAKRGDEINFGDGVVVHILYPSENFHGSSSETNDASVSIVVTYGSESVLLTGDLPSKYEGELLQSALPHNITIYKAGHHGSKYSSSDQLLSYIKPEYAVISAGKDNRYGHPNPETLSRLATYSKEILSTIDRGTISFVLDGETVKVNTDR